MTKILTICVPSYNMQEYLPKCVDSMLAAHIDDFLEIIIVNDGSTDDTLAIANGYKASHPESVVVIDKENGQYGSCVNAALRIARGKYFRTVDADDWVDTEALRTFIDTLKTNDADCFVTRYVIRDTNKNTTKVRDLDVPFWNNVLNIANIKMDYSYIKMHQITWRLSLLHDMNYVQSERVNYSDTEYAFLPFLQAKTIFFCNINLYQYLCGREGQSTAPDVFCKSTDHFLQLCERAIGYNINNGNIFALDLRKRLCLHYLRCSLSNHIFYNYKNKEVNERFRKVLSRLQYSGITYEDIYPDTGMLIKYIKMWHKPNPIYNLILMLRRRMI